MCECKYRVDTASDLCLEPLLITYFGDFRLKLVNLDIYSQ